MQQTSENKRIETELRMKLLKDKIIKDRNAGKFERKDSGVSNETGKS